MHLASEHHHLYKEQNRHCEENDPFTRHRKAKGIRALFEAKSVSELLNKRNRILELPNIEGITTAEKHRPEIKKTKKDIF